MKRILILFSLAFYALSSLAQNIGIGTTNPNAKLDIKAANPALPSNTDGLLIPRMDSFPATNPTALQNGMLVQLTTTTGGFTPGIYSWNNSNTAWDKLLTSIPTAAPSWLLAGNGGTNPTTNFIGTTDDVDLLIKRNNILAGKITTSNLSIGIAALPNGPSGYNNTNNIAFGNYALNANTTGNNNTALGNYVLNANTNGFANIGIGYYALNKNTTGSGNIAQGLNALLNNTTGFRNLAIGVYALSSNTTGFANQGIGYNALNNNTTGNNNIANGNNALFNNTTGNSNVATGAGALISNTTASNNVAYGNNALSSNTTGTYNSATGGGALTYSNGSYNVANGSFALYNNSGGNENTGLGFYALYNNTGNYNTAIGSGALSNVTVGNNNVGIGNNALVYNGNGSNQLSISNFVYGQDLDDLATGKIGIGVQVPSERLEVAGKTKTTDLQITNNAAAGKVLISDATGNAVWGLQSALNTWGLTGNAGTNAATNFIGTTDDNDLIFKRNNVTAGKIAATNISFGSNTLTSNTTGNFNVAMGTSALSANTTGLQNTAAGYFSMKQNVSGNNNAAYGAYSLSTNSSGTNNTALGNYTLLNNTIGLRNTAISFSASSQNVDGNDNVAMGYQAAQANISGNRNTAIGTEAMFNNTASDNTAVGFRALLNNTTGTNNSALGSSSLISNTTGNQNTAVGYRALLVNATGNGNTALGSSALFNNISGLNNIAIGASALYNATTASGNVAIGQNAMATYTVTGEYNTAVGTGALTLNTTGGGNVAVGTNALNVNTTGGGNIALGLALGANTSGNYNMAMGERALNANTTGINNVSLGKWSSEALVSGNDNTAVGHRAGQGMFGAATNNVTIGFNAQVPTGNGSNQVSIANVIYATGTSTAGAGNVGIGTGTPATKLDVAGTTKTLNFQMTSGGGNNLILRSDANGYANWQSISSLEADPKIGGQVTNQVPKWNGSQFVNGAITDNGNIGIGTTNPLAQFHVSGPFGLTTPSLQRSYFHVNSGSNINQDVNASGNVLVRVDGWTWANGGGFLATSDARIKNIKGITNNAKDLADLAKIEITDYKYKDEISNGSTPQKKVIAQQLQSIYPIAVNKGSGIIPSVFEAAKTSVVKENKTIITTNKPHAFATGDEVKLILDKSGEKTYKVTVLNTTTFGVDAIINEAVFVYGKKVNDLLNVDYDALTTLNISATQQLIKEVNELKKENEQLKKIMDTKLTTLLKQIQDLEREKKLIATK